MNPPSQDATLGYAPQDESGLRARIMRAIERSSGLQHLRPKYEIWRSEIAGKDPRMMNVALDMLGTKLVIDAPQWPARVEAREPLVMIANHPFGIGDGIALTALAEDLGRPYRVLLNKEFLRVPEIAPVALPIDFDETPQAVETNIRTRKEARALLAQGVTIIVFPGGGVATARLPWGKAQELPWKAFAARLIQSSRAAVLPVYFEGQNSPLFHAMSRVSGSLRMSLLVAEFRKFAGSDVRVHIGPITPFGDLRHGQDRAALLDELYVLVHCLAPGNAALSYEALKPPAPEKQMRWAWDPPLAKRRGSPF